MSYTQPFCNKHNFATHIFYKTSNYFYLLIFKLILTNVTKAAKLLKIQRASDDKELVRQIQENPKMLKKIVKPACNVCGSVEYILRGARKRRSMAVANARNINMESGIKPKLAVVK